MEIKKGKLFSEVKCIKQRNLSVTRCLHLHIHKGVGGSTKQNLVWYLNSSHIFMIKWITTDEPAHKCHYGLLCENQLYCDIHVSLMSKQRMMLIPHSIFHHTTFTMSSYRTYELKTAFFILFLFSWLAAQSDSR